MLQIVERKIKMKTVKLRKNEVDEVIRLLKKSLINHLTHVHSMVRIN